MNNKLIINDKTQELIMKFFLNTSIPKILKDQALNKIL